jgi:hypothetical protein
VRAAALVVFVSVLASCCPPVILTDNLPPGRVGEPYYLELQADCWDGFWWVSGELPPGMSFDSNGILRGAPRYSGLYFLTITWEDVFEGEILSSVSKSFDLLIVEEDEPLREPRPNAFRDGSDRF